MPSVRARTRILSRLIAECTFGDNLRCIRNENVALISANMIGRAAVLEMTAWLVHDALAIYPL